MPALKQILSEAKTIAVVGASANMFRTSHYIARFLQQNGYRVIPVNPNLPEELLSEKTYSSLQEIPESVNIDLVNIFRKSIYTEEVVRDAIERSSKTGVQPVIWTQLGVSSESAKALAEKHKLTYVENECIMVAYERYF